MLFRVRTVKNFKTVCDDCIARGGIDFLTMNGPKEGLVVSGPSFSAPLGDAYLCGGCGRGYGTIIGYFTMGNGVTRVRSNPRCYEDGCRLNPMYVKAPASAVGPVTFACPDCGHEEEHEVLAIPEDQWRAA